MKNRKQKRQELVDFGNMIREKREELGMTEETIAEKANRCDREIRDIELGKSEPLLGTALRLCDVCGVDVGELKEFIPREESSYV